MGSKTKRVSLLEAQSEEQPQALLKLSWIVVYLYSVLFDLAQSSHEALEGHHF